MRKANLRTLCVITFFIHFTHALNLDHIVENNLKASYLILNGNYFGVLESRD